MHIQIDANGILIKKTSENDPIIVFKNALKQNAPTKQNTEKTVKPTIPDLIDHTRPEAIFTVPKNISPLDWEDAIGHSLDRVKGSLITVARVLTEEEELPQQAVKDCLWGVIGQVEIIEKLMAQPPVLSTQTAANIKVE